MTCLTVSSTLKTVSLTSVHSKFQEVDSSLERINKIFQQSVAEIDYSACRPLINGLQESLQKLAGETQVARDQFKENSKTLDRELSECMAQHTTIVQERDALSKDCENKQRDIDTLKKECSDLEIQLEPLDKRIKELENLQAAVREKRWNMLFDLIPLHGLISGIKKGDIKSGLLRSIPGVSVVVGVKSLIEKENKKLQDERVPLVLRSISLTCQGVSKNTDLIMTKHALRLKNASLEEAKKKVAAKSSEVAACGVKVNSLNEALRELNQLINGCTTLSLGTDRIVSKIEHNSATRTDISRLLSSCKQFQHNHPLLLTKS